MPGSCDVRIFTILRLGRDWTADFSGGYRLVVGFSLPDSKVPDSPQPPQTFGFTCHLQPCKAGGLDHQSVFFLLLSATDIQRRLYQSLTRTIPPVSYNTICFLNIAHLGIIINALYLYQLTQPR